MSLEGSEVRAVRGKPLMTLVLGMMVGLFTWGLFQRPPQPGIGWAFSGSFAFFLFLLRGNLFPLWTYTGKGWIVWGFFNLFKRTFHGWEEVRQIKRGFGGPLAARFRDQIFLYTDNGLSLSITPNATWGYKRVLVDVVQNVQRANPSAVIDPAILARVKELT